MRRILPILIALILSIAAASTASADLEPIQVIDPPNNSTVTATSFLFSWEATMAINYKVKLRSADGVQFVKLTMSAEDCDTTCVLLFDAAAHNWLWRDGAVYKWQVIALDSIGTVTTKSAKVKFTSDVLPTIVLNSPASGAVVSGDGVVFDWSADTRADQYRIVLTDPDNIVHKTAWLDRVSACDASECDYAYPFAGLSGGHFKWKVQAHRANTAGKTTSAKQGFYFSFH